MASFDLAIPKILAREGGDKVTDNPKDPGGLTKFGISQKSYPKMNIRALTETMAKQLYRADFWTTIRGDDIQSQSLAEAVFDAAVNHGPGTVIKWLQSILGVSQDGVLGPLSVTAINKAPELQTLALFRVARIRNYASQVQKTPSKREFLLGWVIRGLEA